MKGKVIDMVKGCSGNTHSTAEMNHYANQQNPNNDAYKAAADNHSNQCNPNHIVRVLS